VRPLTEKYVALQNEGNLSIVFCLLINRVHFLRDDTVATKSISGSRAALCEILALRVCSELGNNMLYLARSVTTSWPVYSGADAQMIAQVREDRDDDLEDHVGNAIEIAILGKAKRFIKSAACQKIIDSIWSCVRLLPGDAILLIGQQRKTGLPSAKQSFNFIRRKSAVGFCSLNRLCL